MHKDQGSMFKRWLMVAACLGLAGARLLWPNLKVDVTTIWLLVIAAVFFLMPEFRALTPYIKRIRVGDTEVELKDQIKDLGEKVEQAEEAVTSKPEQGGDTSRQAEEATTGDIEEIVRLLSSNPRAALLLLSAKLEHQIFKRLDDAGVTIAASRASLPHAVDASVKAGIFTPELMGTFRDFWTVRNRVAHGAAPDVDDSTIASLVGVGLDLMRILTAG